MSKLDELVEEVGKKFKYTDLHLTYTAEGNTRWMISASNGEYFVHAAATDTAEEGLELLLADKLENKTKYA